MNLGLQVMNLGIQNMHMGVPDLGIPHYAFERLWMKPWVTSDLDICQPQICGRLWVKFYGFPTGYPWRLRLMDSLGSMQIIWTRHLYKWQLIYKTAITYVQRPTSYGTLASNDSPEPGVPTRSVHAICYTLQSVYFLLLCLFYYGITKLSKSNRSK